MWHQIETAPKDGTAIDLFVVADQKDQSWAYQGRVPSAWWSVRDECWKDMFAHDIDGVPTHWMQIPEAPFSKAMIKAA